jgi:major vault protein
MSEFGEVKVHFEEIEIRR